MISDAAQQTANIKKYYRRQSRIYDLTRWSFLCGRKAILEKIPHAKSQSLNILEIGCGTGFNLANLAVRFPNAVIHGVDVSPDMLKIAAEKTKDYGERIHLHAKAYCLEDTAFSNQMDVILFSYALSMINPQWPELLEQARQDLRSGGVIAVVDFHNSRFPWFRRHMGNHHVRMDGHLLPALSRMFPINNNQVVSVYGRVWEYFSLVGYRE